MRTILLLTLALITGENFAQQLSPLTIVYDINISKTKKSTGIEETYNGGTKAVFIAANNARIRMVSLMRIESIFFEYDSLLKKAVVVKESGAQKYRFDLSAAEWKHFNKQYDDVVCSFENDSMLVAGYPCKKAVISLSSGEDIIAYYTDSLKPANSFIEPAFHCIPGIVLQYEHASKNGLVVYKASQVSRETFAKDIFLIPSTGVQRRKYTAKESND